MEWLTNEYFFLEFPEPRAANSRRTNGGIIVIIWKWIWFRWARPIINTKVSKAKKGENAQQTFISRNDTKVNQIQLIHRFLLNSFFQMSEKKKTHQKICYYSKMLYIFFYKSQMIIFGTEKNKMCSIKL